MWVQNYTRYFLLIQSISQETGYDTEYPAMSQQLKDIPNLKHTTAQPKPKRTEAVKSPILQARTSRKKRSKSNSVVKITNNFIHAVPKDVPTTSASRSTVGPVLLSFHHHQAVRDHINYIMN